ncbi:DUF4822 domain-containing protein [Microbacterium sp. NPDC057659]|uniref:DUF4822 domain-containing protein n=1 Tax=Microbacterium sp. NPDC057659 TaxID=3346198 RepID=UPI00366E2C67
MTLKKPMRTIMLTASAFVALGLLAGCTAAPTEPAGAPASSSAASEEVAAQTPSDVLSSTAWETSGATDAAGADVALDDENVKNFVGWAYFKDGGSFTMYNLDDSPKMQGDWTVTEDGKTRHIVAKDDAGEVLFERDSDIVTLTDEEFTYRVFPDPENTEVYFDIIHTPTDHEEPAA